MRFFGEDYPDFVVSIFVDVEEARLYCLCSGFGACVEFSAAPKPQGQGSWRVITCRKGVFFAPFWIWD